VRAARWAGSERELDSRSAWRLNAALGAWRMYATRSAASATRATARSEESTQKPSRRGCRPSVVRIDAAGDVAEPLSRARVALGTVASSALGQSRVSPVWLRLSTPTRLAGASPSAHEGKQFEARLHVA
jgi:hypothetical protein